MAERPDSSFAGTRRWLLLSLAGLVGFYALALVLLDVNPADISRVAMTGPGARPARAVQPEPVEASPPTPTPRPDPIELLRETIAKELGRSNRDVPRLSVVAIQGERLVVVWAINDNLTRGFVARSGQMDAAKILQTIAENTTGLPFFSSVFLAGTFAMVDRFGSGSEDRVVRLTFAHSTMKKINWPRFNDRVLYEIADSASVHQDFRVE